MGGRIANLPVEGRQKVAGKHVADDYMDLSVRTDSRKPTTETEWYDTNSLDATPTPPKMMRSYACSPRAAANRATVADECVSRETG